MISKLELRGTKMGYGLHVSSCRGDSGAAYTARAGQETRMLTEGEKVEHHEDLSLIPPAESFELYRHKHAAETNMAGWSGFYWARRNDEDDYEIRAVNREGEAYSVPSGVFPGTGF